MEDGSVEDPVGMQVPPNRIGFSPNLGNFVGLTIVLFVIIQINKKKQHIQNNLSLHQDSVGLEAIPKVPKAVPLKLIGHVLYLWPISNALKVVLKWYEEMGDVFRGEGLNQDFVCFNSGPTIQALLKSGDFGHVHKLPVAYKAFQPYITNGVMVSDGPLWQKQRKILMKSQSFKNLRGYMEMLNRHCDQLVCSLNTRFEDGVSHLINDIINVTFLEVMTEMITGEKQDRSEELHQYHKNFTVWKDTVPFRALNPLFLLEPLWKFHPRYKKFERACQELSDFARRIIKEAKQKQADTCTHEEKNKPAFCSILYELLDAGVDETQMVDEINTMMFGGHETGASAIHCLCFALALNKDVQEQAGREVDEFFAESANIKNGQITHDACQSGLKYVERCVLEALRLFPPGFVMGRKLLKPLEFEHEGKNVVIPTGTNCILLPFAIHRMEKHYPNPLKFDPDRFLPEEVEKRHAYTYLAFSAGPRNCLGLKFAMLEMKTMMSYILRHFELSTTDRMEDITWLPHTTLTPHKDFSFTFKKRNVINFQ